MRVARPLILPRVPEHLHEFYVSNIGAWGIFDDKYLDDLDQMPSTYEPGVEPIQHYALGRVGRENVRACLFAWHVITSDAAARLQIRALTEAECKRQAMMVLYSLNGPPVSKTVAA